MIVLTATQKDNFNLFKQQFQALLDTRNVDAIPIEIKNNLWILPEKILSNENFTEILPALAGSEIREVLADEFINYNIP